MADRDTWKHWTCDGLGAQPNEQRAPWKVIVDAVESFEHKLTLALDLLGDR